MPVPDISELSASEIDAVIAQILIIRPAMLPAQPAEPPSYSSALADPAWRAFLDMGTGMSIVRLCHPALGWLDFALPAMERAKLAGVLVTHSLTPIIPPTPAMPPVQH